jgi:hypothetical protein
MSTKITPDIEQDMAAVRILARLLDYTNRCDNDGEASEYLIRRLENVGRRLVAHLEDRDADADDD